MTEADLNKIRVRRTKKEVELAIKNAAVEEIKGHGFSNALVTNIMARAKIEPSVFYNRYDNLDEFYDELVRDYDYWFHDIVSARKNAELNKDTHSSILKGLLVSLLQSPVMAELLRWEISTGNDTTRRTAMLREFFTHSLARDNEELLQEKGLDLVAVSALLIGGVYYLVLHKDRAPFSGIDLNTEEGVERIQKAIDGLSSLLFDGTAEA